MGNGFFPCMFPILDVSTFKVEFSSSICIGLLVLDIEREIFEYPTYKKCKNLQLMIKTDITFLFPGNH